MSNWMVGQRCASQGEPTLGLGIIRKVGDRNLHVFFPATQTERLYAKTKAPLRRVQFEPGETVTSTSGNKFVVEEVREQNGILIYLGSEDLLPETELDHGTVYSRPDQQLLAGHIFKPVEFELRVSAWELKHHTLASDVRGLVGPRIQLLAHQMYIANEASNRHHPRILLSDEVGLGKTIEAGLIFHKLWMSGEVKRVLTLVPSTLVHQWLTEFYRKFNILFNIMTPEHAEELQSTHPDMNPYLAHQCVLQNLDELLESPELCGQVLAADWDLLIVDEAHHLHWSEEDPSLAYELVSEISQRSGGVLLLTATPRQLGLESHFGRLKLLDPQRFDDFGAFCQEAERYQEIAELSDSFLQGELGSARKELKRLFPQDQDLQNLVPDNANDDAALDRLIQAMVDRHGTGRIVFRNRRKVMQGFPKREVHPVYLEINRTYKQFVDTFRNQTLSFPLVQKLLAGIPALSKEDLPKKITRSWVQRVWQEDPRLEWLIPYLRRNREEKFLLICSHKQVVLALQERLAQVNDLEIAYFHEDLNITERDRQAAYFAKEDGAQILICSEIGSEGRNFQFMNHLILFDLPINPALLEQRIGRVDRIGQSRDIQIIIPIPKSSLMEKIFIWYQKALNAFEQPLLEGDFLFDQLNDSIPALFRNDPEEFDAFIELSQRTAEHLKHSLEQGRDKLLERHSFDPQQGNALVSAVESVDDEVELKQFMDGAFDLFGVHVEDQESPPIQFLRPTSHMMVTNFPNLPLEGLEITYSRELAIQREELAFMSYDHPMVSGTIDLLLNMERGVTSFSLWKQAPTPGILVQSLWILESPGAGDLGLERYLPPTPFLITIDQNQKIRADLQALIEETKIDKGPLATLHQQRNALGDILSTLLNKSEDQAQTLAASRLKEAKKDAHLALNDEIKRLQALAQINPGIHPEEIDALHQQLGKIDHLLGISQVRLDAIRMILMVP